MQVAVIILAPAVQAHKNTVGWGFGALDRKRQHGKKQGREDEQHKDSYLQFGELHGDIIVKIESRSKNQEVS